MAIVAMKRVTVVAPTARRDSLLAELQALGLLHIEPLTESGELPVELSARLMGLKRCQTAMQSRAGSQDDEGAGSVSPELAAELEALNEEEVYYRTERALAHRTTVEGQINALTKEEALAAPWGTVTADDLATLAAKGLQLRAYRATPETAATLDLPDGVWALSCAIATGDGEAGCLLVGSFDEVPSLDLDEMEPPPRSLAAVRADLKEQRVELARVERELDALQPYCEALDSFARETEDRIQLVTATQQSRADEDIFAVTGWSPESEVPRLREAVLAAGGATLVAAPATEDAPPVELRNGPIVGAFEPLLKAFQLPHYREWDPTFFVAPFMGVFFGFCLGDAAYGLILFTIATLISRKVKPGTGRQAVRMLQVFGVLTMVVGLLVGNAFGEKLYELSFVKDLGLTSESLLFALNEDPANFFYASLYFGVAQLGAGILIRLVRQLANGQIQHAIGSLGWFLVVPGALIVYSVVGAGTLLYILLGVAYALILLFNSPASSVGSRIGGGAWAVYNATFGLFGDVLSYARIFGLGLSSAIIAHVVNILAMTVKDSAPVVGWILAALLLFVGHSFNFAMAFIGSVVHPARLQFLEYFDKFFEGGGEPYSPLRRTKGG